MPTFFARRLRLRRLNKETDLSLFINKILTRNNERVGERGMQHGYRGGGGKVVSSDKNLEMVTVNKTIYRR